MVIDDRRVIVTDYAVSGVYSAVVWSARQCTTTETMGWRMLINGRHVEVIPATYGNDACAYTLVAPVIRQPKTKAEKNQARLKQLRGRAGRWA